MTKWARVRGATSPRTAVSRAHCSHPSVTAQRSRQAAFYSTAPIHERVSNPFRAPCWYRRLLPPVIANDIREREHVLSWLVEPLAYPRRPSIAGTALIRSNVIMGVGGGCIVDVVASRPLREVSMASTCPLSYRFNSIQSLQSSNLTPLDLWISLLRRGNLFYSWIINKSINDVSLYYKVRYQTYFLN